MVYLSFNVILLSEIVMRNDEKLFNVQQEILKPYIGQAFNNEKNLYYKVGSV